MIHDQDQIEYWAHMLDESMSDKTATVGQWYLICADEHAAESEYDRITRGELKRPDEIATETTVRIFGPFDSAYDANLRWWEEYGREAIGAREGITDFDVECAENEYEPDCPRDSGWQSNGDDDMRDWCRTRYDVVDRSGMQDYRQNADEVIMMGRQ